jgi:hypothetical protein
MTRNPTMTTPRLIAMPQQCLSFGLAALFTACLLLSLGAQADDRHAQAVAQTHPGAGAAPSCSLQAGALQPGNT